MPLLAPMVDVYLIYGLVYLDPATTGAIWSVTLLLQVTAGVVAFRLERGRCAAWCCCPCSRSSTGS